jgi:hypothetical protein
MGLIWDLIQQGQIGATSNRTATLEQRVMQLEDELRQTNQALMALLKALERRFGEDLNGDGRIG